MSDDEKDKLYGRAKRRLRDNRRKLACHQAKMREIGRALREAGERTLEEADSPRLKAAMPGSGVRLPEHHDVAYVSREDLIDAVVALRQAARQVEESVAEVDSFDYD